MHDFVGTEYCFHLTKKNSGIVEKVHFGVKNRFFFFFFFFFLKIPVCLSIFWSSIVGAINTFVAEHVANMLS